MKIENFYRATSLDEALQLLNRYGKKAQIAAGCTDLLVHVREGKNTCPAVIDISSVRELKAIRIQDGYVTIGGLVTFSEVVENETIRSTCQGLWEACKSVGSPQIRNAATLGGNIANGSPAADSAPPLLALDAEVMLECADGKRQVPLSEFYLGKGRVDLRPTEMITHIRFRDTNQAGGLLAFEKLGLRNALAISRISASAYVELDNERNIKCCRIGSGSIGLTPTREYELEALLEGELLNTALIEKAADAFEAEIEKRLSGRSSMPYKKQAIRGVIKNVLFKIVDLRENGGAKNVQP